VSIFEGSTDELDEGLRQAREQVLPSARQLDGFKGLSALGERHSSKMLGITFWESEDAMGASEEAANRMREETSEAGGGR
jgi:heme-degrading monooxygenase HmoA